MGQCQQRKKDGTLCQISTKDGQKYCHVHKKSRWFSRISVSAIILAIITFFAFLDNITSFFNNIGMNTKLFQNTAEITLTAVEIRSISLRILLLTLRHQHLRQFL